MEEHVFNKNAQVTSSEKSKYMKLRLQLEEQLNHISRATHYSNEVFEEGSKNK